MKVQKESCKNEIIGNGSLFFQGGGGVAFFNLF